MSDEKKIEKLDVNSDFQDEQIHKDPIQEENKQELKVENNKTLNLTDENFEEKVIKSSKPVVVDFWAEWCGPCKMIAPILEELSDEFSEKVIICKHNIDKEPNTPSKFGVRGIPTLLMFKNGELKSTKIGATTKSNLKSWIEENLSHKEPIQEENKQESKI